MDDDDDNPGGGNNADEYSSARKLVQRAADREALLRLFKVNDGGGGAGGTGGGHSAWGGGDPLPSSSSSSSSAHPANDVMSSSDIKSSSSSSSAVAAGGTGSDYSSSGGLGSDFSNMKLKRDHVSRPCWTCPDGTIYLEAHHALYSTAYDFLVAISEPVTRPEYVHEYRLTPYSLYAAVATNIDTDSILKVLQRYSKNALPNSVMSFIRECTKRYGKARLVLKHNRYHVESDHPSVLRELLRDDMISQARITEEGGGGGGTGGDDVKKGGGGNDDDDDAGGKRGKGKKDADGFAVHTKAEEMEENLRILKEMDGDDDDDDDDDDDVDDGGVEEMDDNVDGGGGTAEKWGRDINGRRRRKTREPKTTVSFQIKSEDVEIVKRRAIE
jgi:DNA excision repair protein ERCC-3